MFIALRVLTSIYPYFVLLLMLIISHTASVFLSASQEVDTGGDTFPEFKVL